MGSYAPACTNRSCHKRDCEYVLTAAPIRTGGAGDSFPQDHRTQYAFDRIEPIPGMRILTTGHSIIGATMSTHSVEELPIVVTQMDDERAVEIRIANNEATARRLKNVFSEAQKSEATEN